MRVPLHLALLMTFSLLSGCACFDPFCWCTGNSYFQAEVPPEPDVLLPPPVMSVHVDQVTGIIQELTAELKHARDLHLEQANTYYNEEGIHTIQLKFYSQAIVELCQARMLIVDLVETFLAKLNEDPYLAPEFVDGGFFPHNLEIYINFTSYYNKYVDPYYTKWIFMENGKIVFYTADVDDNDKSCWHTKRESFYTSRDIVYYQRQGEETYRFTHEPLRSIFGSKRFFPTE